MCLEVSIYCVTSFACLYVALDTLTDAPIPENPIEDPNIPMGQGYSESKWVAEQILNEAAKATPLQPVVVRIGQISGGLNGSWNTSDWVPLIVKSSMKMGVLPDLKGVRPVFFLSLFPAV